MILKCNICKDGGAFECENPYEMITHLEEHWKTINWLCNRLRDEKFGSSTKTEEVAKR